MPICYFFAALIGLISWLTPNHYVPWLSFHAELTMAAACFLALAATVWAERHQRWPLPALTHMTLAVSVVPLLQLLFGIIVFAGDAWMAFVYLLGFALSQWLGQRLTHRFGADQLLERLAHLFVCASTLSVGLALYQWLSLTGLGIFAVELPPNGRPYANFAQPNHLATMLYLGVIGALFLYESRRIGLRVVALTVVFFAFGMTMTSSRTAWLEMAVLVGGLFVLRKRAKLRLPFAAIPALALSFFGLLLCWQPLGEFLLLSPGRTFAIQAEAGPRTLLWSTSLDAISRQPWFGYGWNQGLVAQSRVVVDHPAGGRLIESAHNIVLDMAIWNGVPLGLALIVALFWWLMRRARHADSPVQAYLVLGIAGVFGHAMVEYPLSYTYFLLPIGIMMGALDAVAPIRHTAVAARWHPLALASISGAMIIGITTDYLRVEENTRTLRFETARIGTGKIESTAPPVLLLTQWREYLKFARVEAHAGMSTAELAWMRDVAERFPYASAQFRYALASALNADSATASETLQRLCSLQNARVCASQVEAWRTLANSARPELAAVRLPK